MTLLNLFAHLNVFVDRSGGNRIFLRSFQWMENFRSKVEFIFLLILILERRWRKDECRTLAAGSLPLRRVRLRDIPDHSIDSSRISPASIIKTAQNYWRRTWRLFWDLLMLLFCLFNTLIPETLQFMFFLLQQIFNCIGYIESFNLKHKICVRISKS